MVSINCSGSSLLTLDVMGVAGGIGWYLGWSVSITQVKLVVGGIRWDLVWSVSLTQGACC